MSSVGDTLRLERLRKQLSLEQISRETKISARLLEAIEQDRFDRLPGGVFAKSFVRQYARFLGLDEQDFAAELEKAIHPASALPGFAVPLEPVFKVPRVTEWEGTRSNSSVLPALAGVVTVMLVCSAVYALWLKSRRPVQAPPPPAAVQKVPVPTVAPPVEQTPPAPTSQAAVPPPADINTNTGAALRVSLSTDADVWVHAWADNKSVMEGLMKPTEAKTIEAVDVIRIRTGNAGDLRMTVNGKPVGQLGPKGQIRIVEVTPKGVQILPPPPKPAPAPEPL